LGFLYIVKGIVISAALNLAKEFCHQDTLSLQMMQKQK